MTVWRALTGYAGQGKIGVKYFTWRAALVSLPARLTRFAQSRSPTRRAYFWPLSTLERDSSTTALSSSLGRQSRFDRPRALAWVRERIDELSGMMARCAQPAALSHRWNRLSGELCSLPTTLRRGPKRSLQTPRRGLSSLPTTSRNVQKIKLVRQIGLTWGAR